MPATRQVQFVNSGMISNEEGGNAAVNVMDEQRQDDNELIKELRVMSGQLDDINDHVRYNDYKNGQNSRCLELLAANSATNMDEYGDGIMSEPEPEDYPYDVNTIIPSGRRMANAPAPMNYPAPARTMGTSRPTGPANRMSGTAKPCVWCCNLNHPTAKCDLVTRNKEGATQIDLRHLASLPKEQSDEHLRRMRRYEGLLIAHAMNEEEFAVLVDKVDKLRSNGADVLLLPDSEGGSN
jgi:hypothetical protein